MSNRAQTSRPRGVRGATIAHLVLAACLPAAAQAQCSLTNATTRCADEGPKDARGIAEPGAEAEAIALALNTLRYDGNRVRLLNPGHQAVFSAAGLRFEPGHGGPAWEWQLVAVERGGRSLVGVATTGLGAEATGPLTATYWRGALREEYVARARTLEQRFVLAAPPPGAGDLTVTGRIRSDGELSGAAGTWRWRNRSGEVWLGDVTVYDAAGERLPALLEVWAEGSRIVVDGAALDAARYPVTIDPEIGANDFRISDMGGTGNATFGAQTPRAAYNPVRDEYLVVWTGNDQVANAFTIYGQRIDAATGAEVGANDFPIGTESLDVAPDVAYNPATDQYLVVWSSIDGDVDVRGRLLTSAGSPLGGSFLIGEDAAFSPRPRAARNTGTGEWLVVWKGANEERGQRLSAAGAEIGADDFQISQTSGSGRSPANAPDIAYSATRDEYLLVWESDDDTDQADDEFEVFYQRLSGQGAAVGDNVRISDMGGLGDPLFDAFKPAVAYDSAQDQYLVVWQGRESSGVTESEIYGQRLAYADSGPSVLLLEVGTNDFRISGAGSNDGSEAINPSVAYDSFRNELLVAWQGRQPSPSTPGNPDEEIFVQLLTPAGVETGDDDLRISDMGGIGNAAFDAQSPALAYRPVDGQFLAVWFGDDDVGGLVDGEFEIFGQRLSFGLFSDGFESGGIAAWSGSTP